MADSGGNQRIDLARPPPVPVVSRPLKTGSQFTLVLPQPRFILKAWDKAIYEAGEEGQLLLKGKNLGDGPFELIIETDGGEGSWTEVDRVKAEVSGGTEAKATFKFPTPKKLTGGKFTKAEWDKQECEPGDKLNIAVEADGLEGEWIGIAVEREESPGEWVRVAGWAGDIKSGKYDSSWETPKLTPNDLDKPVGYIADLKFSDEEIKAGETAWLEAKASQKDGETVRFILEREIGPGKWEEVGHAVSTIKNNEVKAGIEIPKPGLKKVGTVQTAAFAGEVKPGEEATLEVTAVNMDGEELELILEEKDEKTGLWVKVENGTTKAKIESGKAQATLAVPALKDLTPPELAKEQLVSAKFGGPLEIGGKVSLDVVTKGMDGQTLTIILETAEGGEWVPVEETIAHVKGDAASAQITVPAPVRLMAQAVSAAFEKQTYNDGEDVTLVLDSIGLDGELAELSIEEEQPDGRFREIAKDRALLKQGQVKVKLVPPPWQGAAGTGPPPGAAPPKK